MSRTEDLAFFVISNDELFSIADKDLELIVQPNGIHIDSSIKRISSRWIRVVVKASEFHDFVDHSEKLQLHVHCRGEEVGLASAELIVR